MSAADGPAPLRVVLADDVELFREALAGLLEAQGCDVVAQVGDAVALIDVVASLRPDIAVIDIRMPPTRQLEGLKAAVQLRRTHPDTGVLLLSQHVEVTHLAELVGRAASGVGYLLKERVSRSDFLDAVRRIAGGGCAFDPEIVAAMVNGPERRDDLAVLSAREREVLMLMAQGLSNTAVAEHLHLTGKTVETHVRSIFQRLSITAEAEYHRRVLAVLAYLRAT